MSYKSLKRTYFWWSSIKNSKKIVRKLGMTVISNIKHLQSEDKFYYMTTSFKRSQASLECIGWDHNM